jgi:hypothetical protein
MQYIGLSDGRQGRICDFHPVSAKILGPAKGAVGGKNKAFNGFRVGRGNGNADAGARGNSDILGGIGSFGNLNLPFKHAHSYSFRDVKGVLLVRVGKKDGVLVAGKARGNIPRAHKGTKNLRHGDNYQIAGPGAVEIVDLVNPVKVHHHKRHLPQAYGSLLKAIFDGFFQKAPVVQAGKLVGDGPAAGGLAPPHKIAVMPGRLIQPLVLNSADSFKDFNSNHGMLKDKTVKINTLKHH